MKLLTKNSDWKKIRKKTNNIKKKEVLESIQTLKKEILYNN